MTQEEKDLLLKDLCARLPYGVMIQHPDYDEPEVLDTILTPDAYEGGGIQCNCDDSRFEEIHSLKDCKPYLRPTSSMSLKEEEEYSFLLNDGGWGISEDLMTDCIDWLNTHHFDYRGLIEKGLAISTDKYNPYKD